MTETHLTYYKFRGQFRVMIPTCKCITPSPLV